MTDTQKANRTWAAARRFPDRVLRTTTDKTAHTATAELSWDFAGLAYDPAELLALDATPKQFELIRDVTRVFFERRDALLTLELAPPADPLVRAQLRLAVQERIALLDAMTGGWYRTALNASAARDD